MKAEEIIAVLGGLGRVWPDRASASAALGRMVTAVDLRTWKAVLRMAYPRQALKMGYAIFGRDLGLEELAKVQSFSDDWAYKVSAMPSLAPLLRPFVKIGVDKLQDFGQIRQGAIKRGLQPASWKWLCLQRPAVVRKLLPFGWTEDSIFWINRLAKAIPDKVISGLWLEPGRPYMFEPHYQMQMAMTGTRKEENNLALERFFRLVPDDFTAEVHSEYCCLAAAMLLGYQDKQWALVPQSTSTWNGLKAKTREMARRREAMAEEARRTRAKSSETREAEWEPLLGEHKFKSVVARELTSTEHLFMEGEVLGHCVGDGQYLDDCITHKHVLFSLTEVFTGMRATLQLRKASGKSWFVAQLAGVGNSRVPQIFWDASRKLEHAMSA